MVEPHSYVYETEFLFERIDVSRKKHGFLSNPWSINEQNTSFMNITYNQKLVKYKTFIFNIIFKFSYCI